MAQIIIDKSFKTSAKIWERTKAKIPPIKFTVKYSHSSFDLRTSLFLFAFLAYLLTVGTR